MEVQITDSDGIVFDNVTVPDTVDTAETSGEYSPTLFLAPSLCRDFRDAVNSSPIFWCDPKYMANYHLCCAVMDRLDTCIETLNKYDDYPKSEEDFLVFMMFASMVTDAVKEILSQLGIHKKKVPIYGTRSSIYLVKNIILIPIAIIGFTYQGVLWGIFIEITVYTIADAKRKRVNYFLIAKEIGCVLLHQGSGKTNKGKATDEMCSVAFLYF